MTVKVKWLVVKAEAAGRDALSLQFERFQSKSAPLTTE
jgi:hypothetical protein